MYDPSVGEFIEEDPIGFGGGQTNVGEYCGNDPVNFTDPSGLDSNAVLQAYQNYQSSQSQFSNPFGLPRSPTDIATAAYNNWQTTEAYRTAWLGQAEQENNKLQAVYNEASQRDQAAWKTGDISAQIKATRDMNRAESEAQSLRQVGGALQSDSNRAIMKAIRAAGAEAGVGIQNGSASGGGTPVKGSASDDIPLWQYFLPMPTPYGPVYRVEIGSNNSVESHYAAELYKLDYKAAPYFLLAETTAFAGASVAGLMEYVGGLEEIVDFLLELANEARQVTPEHEAWDEFTNPGRGISQEFDPDPPDSGYDGWLRPEDQYPGD